MLCSHSMLVNVNTKQPHVWPAWLHGLGDHCVQAQWPSKVLPGSHLVVSGPSAPAPLSRAATCPHLQPSWGGTAWVCRCRCTDPMHRALTAMDF